MIRLIMKSGAYRQGSARPDALEMAKVDPGNRLLWRMRLRRLEAEAIRDSVLSAAGQLDLRIGGEPVAMDYRPDGMVVVAAKDRGIAVPAQRLHVPAPQL